MDDAAFELIDRAVRIDHEAGIGSAPFVPQPDRFVDIELDDNGRIGGAVFIARKTDAAAAA